MREFFPHATYDPFPPICHVICHDDSGWRPMSGNLQRNGTARPITILQSLAVITLLSFLQLWLGSLFRFAVNFCLWDVSLRLSMMKTAFLWRLLLHLTPVFLLFSLRWWGKEGKINNEGDSVEKNELCISIVFNICNLTMLISILKS